MRDAEQIRYLILAAQREGNRQLTAALSQIDLTPAQSEALRIITDHGPLALKELGDMLVCDSGSSPSRIADRLVSAGLVQREEAVDDRRRIRLTATAQGRAKAAEVQAIETQLYDAIDAAVSPEAADILLRVLRGITDGSAAGAALQARLAAEAS